MPTRDKFSFFVLSFFIFLICSAAVFAKDTKSVTLYWPADKPAIQVTFGSFSETSRYGGSSSWVVSAEVENRTETTFPSTVLTLVFYDKENAQIGTGTLLISEPLPAHQKLKQQVQFSTTGKPVRLVFAAKDVSLSADHSAAAHVVSITFRSIPTGASLEVDGKPFGLTPKILRVPVGTHTAVLTKPGYDRAEYPFEVGSNDGNGGTVEVELPTSNDILEMRDGTTVGGDVESVSWNSVHIIVGGKPIDYPRNMVKRITMVQRQMQTDTPTTSPQASSK